MNLGTVLMRVFEGTDDQADLDPRDANGVFDLTLESAQRLVGYVRQALGVVASWRTSSGRRLRFKANQGEGFWESPETGRESGLDQMEWILPTQANASRRLVTLPARFSAEDNAYSGAILGIGGLVGESSSPYSYLVIGSTGATLRLEAAPDALIDLDGAPFQLHRRKFPISSLGLPGYIELRSMARTSDLLEISPELGYEYGLANLKTITTPAAYRIEDGYLMFDAALESSTSFMLRYWRYPALTEDVNAELPLPAAFHEAVVHLAKSSIFRRQGETNEAYESWKAAEALLNVLRNEYDFERDELQGTLRPRS